MTDDKKEVVAKAFIEPVVAGPNYEPPKTVIPEEPTKPAVDANTLMYFIWVLYSLNVITRIQVRDFLEVIRQGKWPADIIKFLTDEVKKI